MYAQGFLDMTLCCGLHSSCTTYGVPYTAQECSHIRVLEDNGAGRQLLEAEETVEFAFLHLHKTLRTRLLVTLVRFARPALFYLTTCTMPP